MFNKILLTTDGSIFSLRAVDYVIHLAKANYSVVEVQ